MLSTIVSFKTYLNNETKRIIINIAKHQSGLGYKKQQPPPQKKGGVVHRLKLLIGGR
jgi:hypothetical protein